MPFKVFLVFLLTLSFYKAQPVAIKDVNNDITSNNIPKVIINDFISTARPSKFTIDKIIKTKHFEITFNSQGAAITSLLHKNLQSELKNNIQLISNGKLRFDFYKTPESQKMFSNLDYKLDVLETEKYVRLTASSRVLAITQNKKRIPVLIKKVYTFYQELHYWEYDFQLENLSNVMLSLSGENSDLYFTFGHAIGPKASSKSVTSQGSSFYNFFYADEELESISTLEGGGAGCSIFGEEPDGYIKKNIDFWGSSSRFMILTLQPLQKASGIYSFKEDSQIHAEFKSIQFPPKKVSSLSFIVFTGPKSNDIVDLSIEKKQEYPFLKKLHPKLYKAFNFGITAPIRDFIVWLLGILYYIIPNYGWGILLFSILFKLVFYPLNQKQAESMKKMSALQPQMKIINEKYAKNPQEKQKRIMMLYKEHKINPVSGCLPILIQIPIFIGLYSAFSDSYELWKSPFISGWIDDLSQPDTIYQIKESIPLLGGFNLNILPLLMAVTQYLQGKLTMVTGDDNQQKIMAFLPFILLFFFWNMPSGVTLYWTIQNILSIAQQIYTNKRDSKSIASP